MATGMKTITGSFSPDGTPTTEATFTPNTGELWYVDVIGVRCDGNGSTAKKNGIQVGARNPSTNWPAYSSYFSATASISDGTKGARQTSADFYIDSNLELVIGQQDVTSSGATYAYVVHLRRIL